MTFLLSYNASSELLSFNLLRLSMRSRITRFEGQLVFHNYTAYYLDESLSRLFNILRMFTTDIFQKDRKVNLQFHQYALAIRRTRLASHAFISSRRIKMRITASTLSYSTSIGICTVCLHHQSILSFYSKIPSRFDDEGVHEERETSSPSQPPSKALPSKSLPSKSLPSKSLRLFHRHQIPSHRIDPPSEIPLDSNTCLRRNEDEDGDEDGDVDVDGEQL